MIRVILEGEAHEGRWGYRIATQGTRLSVPIHGLSATPLMDACRKLKELGAAQDQDLIGLYGQSGLPESQYQMRTSVGYGARHTAVDTPTGVKFVPDRPSPAEGPALGRPAAQEPLKSSEGTEGAPRAEKPAPDAATGQETPIPDKWENEGGAVHPTGAKSAKSEAAPRPHSTHPRSPADKGPVPPKPATPESSRHKRKPTGSGGRRGRR